MSRSKESGRVQLLSSPFPFEYEEFDEWYAEYRRTHLEPARITIERLLNEHLDETLEEFDRHRLRVSASRVKSPARLWAKMQKGNYRDRIVSLEAIVDTVDDLVGVRVTCNNLCDIDFLDRLLSRLPSSPEEAPHASLSVEPGSEKRYIQSPKDSGYRAYHVNLLTVVPTMHELHYVRAELQARTLLQDGWGELTHEDTYKPGVELPALVTTLSRRMADLLAAVDDLAQDLRNELDRLAEAVVDEPLPARPVEAVFSDDANGLHSVGLADNAEPMISGSALVAETRRLILSLSKAAALASVAQQVQAAFGTSVTKEWGGFGTFKELVRRAVPEASIVGEPPGFVLPPGAVPPMDEALLAPPRVQAAGVPEAVVALKARDKNLPAVPASDLAAMLDTIAEVLSPGQWDALLSGKHAQDNRELSVLARRARDLSAGTSKPVARAAFEYLLRGLMHSGNLRRSLSRSEIAEALTSAILARMSKFALLEEGAKDREDVRRWVLGHD